MLLHREHRLWDVVAINNHFPRASALTPHHLHFLTVIFRLKLRETQMLVGDNTIIPASVRGRASLY